MPESRSIPVASLLLDLENPRLGEGLGGQAEAAEAVLRAELRKTLVLAEDIKMYGVNPADRLMVMPSPTDSTSYTVLEGNRRLTALRILSEPAIAASVLKAPSLRRLREWSAEYLRNPITEMDCVIFRDRDEARPWIERRHRGESAGAGVVPWGSLEQRRFEARQTGQTSPDLQALDLVAAKGALDEATRETLHDFPITNLERLLDDEGVRKAIGVEVDANRQLISPYPLEEVLKPLTRMVRDIANRRIKVEHIYTAASRAKYIAGFKRSEIPNPAKAGSPRPLIASAAAYILPPAGPKPPRAPVPRLRSSVVDPKCKLNINDARIARVFRELRGLKVDEFPNSVAVMLRVFLEFTVDHYFSKHSLPALPRGKDSLSAKLIEVAQDLQSRGVMTKSQLKPVHHAASEKRVVGANIATFNAFVHNRHFSPMAVDLRAYWDNLQPFFEIVWPS